MAMIVIPIVIPIRHVGPGKANQPIVSCVTRPMDDLAEEFVLQIDDHSAA